MYDMLRVNGKEEKGNDKPEKERLGGRGLLGQKKCDACADQSYNL